MNDQDYRNFFELARTLNFSQAAERLYLSQPALSRCISKLETEFGVQLFIRDKHNVQLTNAGKALLEHYPEVEEASRKLQLYVRDAASGVETRLTIGLQDGHLLSGRIKRQLFKFQEEHPNVHIDTVSLMYNKLFDELAAQRIDLALALNFPNNCYADIEHTTVEKKLSCALISCDHPAAKCSDAKRALSMLDGMDLMLVGWTIVPNVTSFIYSQCIANGFIPSNVRFAPSYSTLYSWLVMEKGFVIMDLGETVFSEKHVKYIPLLKDNEIEMCAYWNHEPSRALVRELATMLSVMNEGAAETGTKKHDSREIKRERQNLPADFYRELLGAPSCVTTGVCTGCGRCSELDNY